MGCVSSAKRREAEEAEEQSEDKDEDKDEEADFDAAARQHRGAFTALPNSPSGAAAVQQHAQHCETP